MLDKDSRESQSNFGGNGGSLWGEAAGKVSAQVGVRPVLMVLTVLADPGCLLCFSLLSFSVGPVVRSSPFGRMLLECSLMVGRRVSWGRKGGSLGWKVPVNPGILV